MVTLVADVLVSEDLSIHLDLVSKIVMLVVDRWVVGILL